MPIEFRHYEQYEEYFDRKLDETQTKTDKSLIGTYWMVSRYIWRIGYMFEPPLMPDSEVRKKAKEMLLEVFQLGINQKGILKLPYVDHHVKKTEEAEKKAKHILAAFEEKKYPLPLYKARGALATLKRIEYEKEHKNNDASWRRMWFNDNKKYFPYWEYVVIKITGVKRCLTGEWYPPSGGYDSWTGEYDYEPGGLSPAIHQSLYLAQFYDLLVKGWVPGWKNRIVHPADLIEVDTDKPILEEA